jgi:hypothetical protein
MNFSISDAKITTNKISRKEKGKREKVFIVQSAKYHV